MRMFHKLAALGCLLAFTLAVTAEDKKDAAKTAEKGEKGGAVSLVGGYTIVSGESDGKELPAERFKGSIVRFTKDEVIGTDKDQKQIFVSKYKLDTTAKPWKIVMKTVAPKEGETTGLIKQEGDTVTIIYATPGGKDPTEFKTEEKQNLFVLKNQKKGGKGKAGGDKGGTTGEKKDTKSTDKGKDEPKPSDK